MKNRFELFSIFTSFFSNIKIQLRQVIKILRMTISNNTSLISLHFLSSHDMLH